MESQNEKSTSRRVECGSRHIPSTHGRCDSTQQSRQRESDDSLLRETVPDPAMHDAAVAAGIFTPLWHWSEQGNF